MRPYTKPLIMSNIPSGLFPIIGAPVFISPVGPIVAVGAVMASILSKKGDSIIDSIHTATLTTRKNFSIA